jgi:hypothetical protein
VIEFQLTGMSDVDEDDALAAEGDMADEQQPLSETVPRPTSKMPLPDACSVRKSAHSRSPLFLPDVPYAEMRSVTSFTQFRESTSRFHSHGLNARCPDTFAKPTSKLCWHCCHSFSTPPIPVPKSFDRTRASYEVIGSFCSLACAKSWILDTTSFDQSQMLVLFAQMAASVYDVVNVVTAPPRYTLECFGGHLSIDAFRGKETRLLVHTPPYVMGYMCVEERQERPASSTQSVTGSLRGIGKTSNNTVGPSGTLEAFMSD